MSLGYPPGMLSAVRIWKIDLESRGEFTLPAFPGPLLRQVTGNMLYRQIGDQAAEAIFRSPDGFRPFRFDTPLGRERVLHRRSQWSVRFVTLESETEQVLVDALLGAMEAGLGEQRVPQEVVACSLLKHGGADALRGGAAPDLDSRVDELVGLPAVTLRCASPTELKRKPVLPDGSVDRKGKAELIRFPTTLDVLRGAHLRAGSLGYGPLPRFDEEPVDEMPGDRRVWTVHRESTAQERAYDLIGVVGAIALRPTPLQCWWLALAEILGVGSDTAQGKGVVRVLGV